MGSEIDPESVIEPLSEIEDLSIDNNEREADIFSSENTISNVSAGTTNSRTEKKLLNNHRKRPVCMPVGMWIERARDRQ